MNNIREIQALNKRELENGVSPEASWHADYRDTAYIYIGGLPFELSEGDIVTIFSQFGEPVHVNLVRDKETGKSRGFAFLKYEDQRSTDLAVDNLGGTTIMGRMLRVDHTRYKRKEEGEERDELGTSQHNQEEADVSDVADGATRRKIVGDEQRREKKIMSKDERELMVLIQSHDDDDPMKDYLIRTKKEEIEMAQLRKKHDQNQEDRRDRHRRHHHRHHLHRDKDGHEDLSRRRRRD